MNVKRKEIHQWGQQSNVQLVVWRTVKLVPEIPARFAKMAMYTTKTPRSVMLNHAPTQTKPRKQANAHFVEMDFTEHLNGIVQSLHTIQVTVPLARLTVRNVRTKQTNARSVRVPMTSTLSRRFVN
jgi:hypothetical protein